MMENPTYHLEFNEFNDKEGYSHYTKANKLILWLDDVNIFYET